MENNSFLKSLINKFKSNDISNNNRKFSHNIKINKIFINEIVAKHPNEYVVFDVETTGLHPDAGDKIIELSLLKYKDEKLIDKYTSLFNPGFKLPSNIVDLTNITDFDLSNKPKICKEISRIIDFMNNNIIIGHNVIFDINFLKNEICNCPFDTQDLSIEYIDTIDIAKKTIYDIDNYKLETLKAYFDIHAHSHRAEEDCIVTNEVYRQCLRLIVEKDARNKKMAENYKKREAERIAKMSTDEREIIDYFIKIAEEHDKKVNYSFMSDKAVSFTLCGIEIGRIKFNGKKRYCRLFAGDFKNHVWNDVDNPEKEQIFAYIDDLFIYVDKEYKRYFLEYGD